MKTRLYCSDFIRIGLPDECCISCHEDDDDGYEMIFLKVDDHSEIDAYICCGMSRAIEEQEVSLRSLFARALWARRRAYK